MNKIEIYPRVIVYKNALPEWEKYLNLLKQSENEDPKYFFEKWDDWYGLGTMMNLPMRNRYVSYDLTSEDSYELLQKEFLENLTEAYYKCTEDYVVSHQISLPNWVNNGISICKYFVTPPHTDMAMSYHTDYRGFDSESPGKKFAITCTIYLNDDYEGGGLSFLQEETGDVIDYKPEAGDIVVFPSGDPVTGTSHFFHGVDKVGNSEKYFIRCFWSYEHPGTKEWHDNFNKYGEKEWAAMDTARMKKEIKSGMWHKYVVNPGEKDPGYTEQTPFFRKNRWRVR
jgi:hypothetical protein